MTGPMQYIREAGLEDELITADTESDKWVCDNCHWKGREANMNFDYELECPVCNEVIDNELKLLMEATG